MVWSAAEDQSRTEPLGDLVHRMLLSPYQTATKHMKASSRMKGESEFLCMRFRQDSGLLTRWCVKQAGAGANLRHPRFFRVGLLLDAMTWQDRIPVLSPGIRLVQQLIVE